MFFDHYPYTNFHNVNLDWVLQAVKAWGRTVEANDRAFKDLKEANESFKAYVRNYLQDLDVSDEINTKLDRMLAEGTLTPYFAPYVKGYVESWLASNVTPTTPALDKTLSIDNAAANAAATGERIESAAYLRTLDGPKLCSLLNKNLIIPGYRIQSACNAGGYFYVCGGSEAADGKGFIAKMRNLDFKDAEITYYTDLGHANDITYSYSTNHLYVTTVGEGVEWGIWDINPNDLTDKTLITNCPENTIGVQYVDGWVFVLAPPRIYRTLDFETYTLVINNTNEILNKFSIQSDGRISQTLVRLPNKVVGWVGSYIKEPEHIWYGFIAYFGSHGAITFDVFPTYNAECQAAIWDGKSTVYIISNGTTGPAYTVLRMDCGNLKYLELGAGKDLNDYTGEGLFYLIGAATMDNCPVNNEGLTLKVSRQGLLNTRQDIYTNSGRHLYRIKLFNAGTWGEWVEQAAEIAQIKEDLSGLKERLSTIDTVDFDNYISSIRYISPSLNTWARAEGVKAYMVPTNGASIVTIRANPSQAAIYACLTDSDNALNTTPKYASGWTARAIVTANTSKEIELPDDCKYVWFMTSNSSTNFKPDYVGLVYYFDADAVTADINTLKSYHHDYSGKIVSILGDSISTFVPTADKVNGKAPTGCTTTYPGNVTQYQNSDVTTVDNTWWGQVLKHYGMTLGINESYAGSTIGYNPNYTDNGKYTADNCLCSETRIGHLGENGTPDIIFVFGGTNDINHHMSGSNVRFATGELDSAHNPYDFANFPMLTDTYYGAITTMLLRIQHTYPNASILMLLPYFCTSTHTSATDKATPYDQNEWANAAIDVCKYLGVEYLDLRKIINLYDVSMLLFDGLHPKANGMTAIANAVIHKLNDML